MQSAATSRSAPLRNGAEDGTNGSGTCLHDADHNVDHSTDDPDDQAYLGTRDGHEDLHGDGHRREGNTYDVADGADHCHARTPAAMGERAGTLDLETVAALGINVQMLRTLNFGVGIYLAGLSGVLAAGQLGLEPTMGTGLLMPSFIAIIVGGIGSLPGTLMGGLLIGVASGLTAVFLPAASEAVIYVMMAVVLLIRPRGLFGEEGMMS